MTSMAKASRDKGKRMEQRIARLLRESTGLDIRRGWQSREGSDEPDVICPRFWIECKSGKRTNIKAAMRQAEADSEKSTQCLGLIPIAVTKDDGQPILVTMLWEDWLEMAREEMVSGSD